MLLNDSNIKKNISWRNTSDWRRSYKDNTIISTNAIYKLLLKSEGNQVKTMLFKNPLSLKSDWLS